MSIVRLAVDVENGDFGRESNLRGVLDAKESIGTPLVLYLCGDKSSTERVLQENNKYSLVESGEIIIEDSHFTELNNPIKSAVWRTEPGSSVVRSVVLQKDGVVDASLSAADTRVLMGSSINILGMRSGIKRPFLGMLLPTAINTRVLLLDIGANVDCSVERLCEFAEVGIEFFKKSCSPNKKIVLSLLNLGEENKGPRVVREASVVFAEKFPEYSGFVEGHDILLGKSDVVVCDGFVGNVLLKAYESFYRLIKKQLADSQNLAEALEKRISALNAENYGAAPMFGLNGIVFKAHGASSSRAMEIAVKVAFNSVAQNIF